MPSFAVETSSRVYYFHPSTKDPEVAQQECDKWLAALTETQERMRVDLLNEKFIAAGGSPGERLSWSRAKRKETAQCSSAGTLESSSSGDEGRVFYSKSPELVELERLARVEARNEMCRARMSIGSYMVKFPYARNRSAKPQYRFVQYDAKRERIRWGPKVGKFTSQIRLRDMEFVVYGARSTSFLQNQAFLNPREQVNCFSLVAKKRSLDLQADTSEMCEIWVLGLQNLLQDRMIRAGRPLLSRAQLIFKRLARLVTMEDKCKRTFAQVVADAMRKSCKDERRQLYEFRLLFDALDVDGSNSLEKIELLNFFRDLGQEVNEEHFERVFDEIDADKNGELSFGEFIQAAGEMFSMDNMAMVATIRNIFNRYDRHRTGTIDEEEVRMIFRTLEGEDMPEELLRTFMSQADPEGTGVIRWPEFMRYALQNIQEFEQYHRALGILR